MASSVKDWDRGGIDLKEGTGYMLLCAAPANAAFVPAARLLQGHDAREKLRLKSCSYSSSTITRPLLRRRGAPSVLAAAAAAGSIVPRNDDSSSEPKTQPQPRRAWPVRALDDVRNFKVFQRLFKRTRVFVALYVAYVFYAVLRSTFPCVSPSLTEVAGLTMSDVGVVTSSFPLFYGTSKLVSGYVVDNRSASAVLVLGLLLSAVCNVGLGFSSQIATFSMFWALNGIFQGLGPGACAKLLTSWFSKEERGLYWAIWSTSGNLGGFFAPFLVSAMTAQHGWRIGLKLIALVSCLVAFLSIPLFSDSPTDRGLDQGEPMLGPLQRLRVFVSGIFLRRKGNEAAESVAANDDGAAGHQQNFVDSFGLWLGQLKRDILNPNFCCLALANMCIYLVMWGLRSWIQFFFTQKSMLSALEVARRFSMLEIGGIVGAFSSGIISDRFDGRRALVSGGYFALLAVALGFFIVVPVGPSFILDGALLFLLGAAMMGPQCLIGLQVAEIVSKRAVATTTGLLGMIACVGGCLAGYPISRLIQASGWTPYFSFLIVISLLGAALMYPLRTLSAKTQS